MPDPLKGAFKKLLRGEITTEEYARLVKAEVAAARRRSSRGSRRPG